MAMSWPTALSPEAFSNGQILSVKISEDRKLDTKERELLLPAIACMDRDDLSEVLIWSKDKLKIFDTHTEFQRYEYEAGTHFNIAYYRPDEATSYCAVTNGDNGVLYEFVPDNDWKIIGIFSVGGGASNHMHKFVPYEDLTADVTIRNMSPNSELSSLSDSEDKYWSQYDDLPSDPDAEPENSMPERPLKRGPPKDLTRVFLRSHVLSVLRDLHQFYTELGLGSETWCSMILSWLEKGQVVNPEDPVQKVVSRIMFSLARFHEQMLIPKADFERDVQLAIVELHPLALSDYAARQS